MYFPEYMCIFVYIVEVKLQSEAVLSLDRFNLNPRQVVKEERPDLFWAAMKNI